MRDADLSATHRPVRHCTPRVERDLEAQRRPELARNQAGQFAGEPLRKHRNASVWQVDGRAPPRRLAIQGAVPLDEMSHVGDVYPDDQTAVVVGLDGQGVVDLPRVSIVDAEADELSEIVAVRSLAEGLERLDLLDRLLGKDLVDPRQCQAFVGVLRESSDAHQKIEGQLPWLALARALRLQLDQPLVEVVHLVPENEVLEPARQRLQILRHRYL